MPQLPSLPDLNLQLPREVIEGALDALERVEHLLEQPQVRVLTVNALFLLLLVSVAVYFYARRQVAKWGPVGAGAELITLITLGLVFYGFIEAYLRPPYVLRSVCKITLFASCIALFQFVHKDTVALRSIFRVERRSHNAVIGTVMLGFLVYMLILAGFLLFRKHIDLYTIAHSLNNDASVTRQTFLATAFYISVVNSLLEEMLFRGYAFLTLRRSVPARYAHTFSACAFSAYHFSTLAGWFSVPILLLLLVSLFFAGLLFNFVNVQRGTVYNSWFVHMFANLAINTIGLIAFGMLPGVEQLLR